MDDIFISLVWEFNMKKFVGGLIFQECIPCLKKKLMVMVVLVCGEKTNIISDFSEGESSSGCMVHSAVFWYVDVVWDPD
mgnify:CR=1 FL=1